MKVLWYRVMLNDKVLLITLNKEQAYELKKTNQGVNVIVI